MPNAYSRAAKAHTHDNRIPSVSRNFLPAGFGSRRKCEEIITEGRVEIDGELVTELGTRVDPHKQQSARRRLRAYASIPTTSLSL